MNYLAHAYLSFNDRELLTGNMISDFVKGKKQFDYPPAIQHGIQFHRTIDAFTDVVYDHFLANDIKQFPTQQDLLKFTQHSYSLLKKQSEYFPSAFARMFPYMHTQDWLYNYRLDEGMQKSFGGLRQRAAYISETETAYHIFLSNKQKIRGAYDAFFPEVKGFAAGKWEEIKRK